MGRAFYIIGALVVLTLVFFFAKGGITGNVVGAAEPLVIPLSEISEQASWYEQNVGGTSVRFFSIKVQDGSIKTAFDACDVCYSSKKGYRQKGDVMICNNCGNRYPISGLGTENKKGGGCWPGYLPSEIKGENLVIKMSDLEKERYRF